MFKTIRSFFARDKARSEPQLGLLQALGLYAGVLPSASDTGENLKNIGWAAHQLVTIADVSAVTAMLCSDAARAMTSKVVFVDAGYHVMG